MTDTVNARTHKSKREIHFQWCFGVGRSMISYRTGDILTDDAEAIVNAVNCVGVMGRGIALQFKRSFPANFTAYAAACRRGEVQPGRMFIYDMGGLTNPRYIVNFPTKNHWRAKSRMEDIDSGLRNLIEEIRKRNIRSIAIPPLGSGLGGLEWAEVRQYIERAFVDMDEVRVVVYEPKSISDSKKSICRWTGAAGHGTLGDET